MTPSHASTEAFSIERMSFGERSIPPEATTTPPETAGVAEEVPEGRVLRQFADDIVRALSTALHELDRQRDAEGGSSIRKLAAQVEFLGESLDQMRQKTEELVLTVSEHGSGVSAALEKCDAMAVHLQQGEGDLSARVNAVVERLDRQAEALRGFVDFRNRVTGALEQVAGLLACLQETAPPASLESL